jgi:hypothetical protein
MTKADPKLEPARVEVGQNPAGSAQANVQRSFYL